MMKKEAEMSHKMRHKKRPNLGPKGHLSNLVRALCRLGADKFWEVKKTNYTLGKSIECGAVHRACAAVAKHNIQL